MTMDHRSIRSLTTDTPDKATLVIVQGRYQNWIKPLILLQALKVPFQPVVLNGLPHMKTEWYRKIHPQRMVPALIDNVDGKRVVIWDSTGIMMYLCDRHDIEKRWTGKTMDEMAEVYNWLIFQTASFGYGPTSSACDTCALH
jgi:gliotoxin/aspirochlorine biosynthesis glutathione S-transferase